MSTYKGYPINHTDHITLHPPTYDCISASKSVCTIATLGYLLQDTNFIRFCSLKFIHFYTIENPRQNIEQTDLFPYLSSIIMNFIIDEYKHFSGHVCTFCHLHTSDETQRLRNTYSKHAGTIFLDTLFFPENICGDKLFWAPFFPRNDLW